MNELEIGCKVRFGEYESVLREVLVDDRCRMDLPQEDGKWILLPQYTQYVFCFYIEETCLCAKGQILSRYRIQNREVMEVEFLEGFYEKKALQMEEVTDISLENLQNRVKKQWMEAAE